MLSGDLGSGKTTFMQGVAHGLGIKDSITSPTFVLAKEYKIRNRAGVNKLIHADAYRLSAPEDFLELGGFDHKDDSSLVFVEWGEKVLGAMTDDARVIRLEVLADEKRKIIFE
ncbi:tRNA (adenosine(37)-N6)-threonylcarbamoyltransferase complex ATPase subunit type 1 TsaE [Candidatus Berkelbacteria bacterium RIFOXYA2_FULL_43_10]|uniref:tRNA threonylcarbamoyladenosine biosynthesis protein TsaE n=1 Tax=Candidatus Berkelbacteria bacterium RIFOXYA2_FULL_43_10 TaxID=1797472 RepID=A0A1F5E8J1_9BACT|nr:MAG: tRNA (adenosine(37)-N6)-threonylcarbamoyltransferase complex ATPase subunit type 1 TsaE [Candidatus Berkelbacteria bacterium RIFOXYA2_FULL_43_10]